MKTWSRDPVKVEFLATLDGVVSTKIMRPTLIKLSFLSLQMPGGDAINKWTGDYLSQKGVKLLALSGM